MVDTHTEAAPARPRRDHRIWVALVLALVLAAAAGLFAYGIGTSEPLWVVIVLAALSFVGLGTLFAALLGFVHVGRLPSQRAFYDAIIDSVADACVVTDWRGRVVYANAPYRALLQGHGFQGQGRLVGIENLYAGYPDIAERVYRLAQAARDGRPAAEEFRLNPGSGAAGALTDRPVWVLVSVSQVETGLGQRYTLWRHSDVTADRERQEAAFAKLQFIISYLDRAPAGFFSTTAEGEIAYVNATLADWLGLDLARTTDGSLKLTDILSPADAQLVMSIAARPGSVRTESFDIDLKPADAGAIPVRIIHRAECGADGTPEPSRSLVLDRRLDGAGTPKALATDQFQRLVNHAPVGMALLDQAGVIVNANGAFVGLSEGKVRGAALADLVSEADRPALGEAVNRALNGETLEPLDVSFAGPSQHTGQLSLHRLDPPSRNGAGKSGPGVFVFALDTTKHSSLEVQLVQSQKMQAVGQLAGGMAHDFNNVLTAIIGFSDLLLARHRPTDPAFADIMNIKQNANRAANLVRQLLAFSRRQTLRPEVLSLTDILSDLGHLLGRLLGEKVELKVVHGRDLWPVKVDVNQFEQVIINLAVNGRDAMPDGGVLTVRTANVPLEDSKKIGPLVMPPGEYVLCEVEDTGTGMPPEVIAKMYEPFFSTKDVGKGTGLGLSTVYGIVRQTGGYIFCDSEVGKGTRFRIYLPRHAQDPAAVAEQREDKKDAARTDLTGRGTILLVEDEDAVRSFASRALASRGYTVLEAESGERALELVEEGNKIDLVLSDVVMPVMDGPSLLKELRKRGIATKVVFISGYAEDAFARNLEGQADFAFLPKPFSLKQLAEAVKEAMEG
jgi:two-component system, cell cycle sensor histidine kinase and response regulator CckA